MNPTTAIFLVSDDVRAIACDYENGSTPQRCLFKTLDKALVAGDYVIVPTESRHKMTVVRVVETDVDINVETNDKVQWIVGRVDRRAYEQVLREEETIIARIKSAELKKKRKDLAAALLADTMDEVKALPLGAHLQADKQA